MNKNVLAARLERLREYIHNLEAAQQFDCKRFIEDPFIHGMATENQSPMPIFSEYCRKIRSFQQAY